VTAGLAAGLQPEAVFVLGDAADITVRLAESGHPLAAAPVYAVDSRVAARLSTLETPPSQMAVFTLPAAAPLAELRAPGLVVYADRLADPGNLGTLVRAAAAFAAVALITSPGSVDLFSPKVVRAGMGAVFELPLYQDATLEQVVAELGAQTVYGLVAHGGAPLDGVAPLAQAAGPAVLVVGAERAGLSAETLPFVTDLLTIPLAGATGAGVESLNAGVAGAIALYELSRRLFGSALTNDGAGPSKE
jgi:TrmH family RNA methyltransferase